MKLRSKTNVKISKIISSQTGKEKQSRLKSYTQRLMSREEDEARLNSCFKKYEEIVKQVLLLDELTDSTDPKSRLTSKRKSNPRGDNCCGTDSGSLLDRESFDQAIVQTITKFLHDLNTSTIDPNPRPSNQ